MKTLQQYISESSTNDKVYIAIDFEKTKQGGVHMFVIDKKNLKTYFDIPQQGDLKPNDKGIRALADVFNSSIEEITGFKILCVGCLGDDQFPVTEI